jgi:hypothetical protein
MLPRARVRGTWPSTASALQKSHGGQIRGAHPCKERKDGAASSCGHPWSRIWSRSARGGPAARINRDFSVCVRARSSLWDFISIFVVDPAMNRWAKLGRPSDFVVRAGRALHSHHFGCLILRDFPCGDPALRTVRGATPKIFTTGSTGGQRTLGVLTGLGGGRCGDPAPSAEGDDRGEKEGAGMTEPTQISAPVLRTVVDVQDFRQHQLSRNRPRRKGAE